jgi:hypothetical protein
MFNYNQKGFSLLGVIIALFVTSVGLVTILSLANISLKGASLAKTRLIASGLAQEGVEIVRDIRKANLEWSDWEWYSGAIATSTTQSYRVQYNNSSLMSFSETPLKLDTSTGLYQYDSGDNSPFYRKVTLTKNSYREVKVVVEVKWRLKGQWHYLTVEDRLWNWK